MTDGSPARPARTQFFANTALAMLALVLASFSFTYFWPIVSGGGRFSPLFHIHGAAYFSWMALYVWQTRLAASGRTASHREWGLAGVALSGLMVPLGVAVAIAAAHRRAAEGKAFPYESTLFNVTDLASFAIFMIAAIATVTRRVDWHRRFMFAAAISLMGPALSRWLIVIPPAAPWTDMLPNLAADLFLVGLLLHDRRTLGRVHPATWISIIILVPISVIVPLLIGSDWWHAVGPGIASLAS